VSGCYSARKWQILLSLCRPIYSQVGPNNKKNWGFYSSNVFLVIDRTPPDDADAAVRTLTFFI
jgi:hypothetical protein